MPPVAINMRKRSRSPAYEVDFETQTKQFINDRIVNENDSDKMKQIHGMHDFIFGLNPKTIFVQIK